MDFLKSVTELWVKQFQRCRDKKREQFGKTANTIRRFMGKSYTDLYLKDDADVDGDFTFPNEEQQGPYYKPRIHKTQEFLALMLPFVAARIPHRLVTPRRPPIPDELAAALPQSDEALQAQAQDQMRAWLMQWWLNFIPGEYGAKREQRMAIQEGLALGRGVVWQELMQGPSGTIPGSFFDSVDNLYIDADCTQWRDASYVIRERHWPSWRLADWFGVSVEKVRSARKTWQQNQGINPAPGTRTGTDTQEDSVPWLEVWSRMGIGHKLYGAAEELKNRKQLLDEFGPNVHFSLLPGLDYPLNITPDAWLLDTDEEFRARLEWPLAFYDSVDNPFPCTPLDIYPNTQNPWARSPLEGALSLQLFLDHLYAFGMSRVRTTCRDIILTAKVLETLVTEALESGLDQIIVPMEGLPGEEIEKLVHILQFPPITMDYWKFVQLVERAFEQATGMDPLLYGSEGARQMRSAEEAGARQANVTNRPNDYADAVEEWNSQIAKAEAQASRMYVGPSDVAGLFREPPVEDGSEDTVGMGPLTQAWATLINTDDPAEAASELAYTVESGSGRRKNKQKQLADAQMLITTYAPFYQQLAMGGMVEQHNALLDIVGEAYEIPRLERLKISAEAMIAMAEQAREDRMEEERASIAEKNKGKKSPEKK